MSLPTTPPKYGPQGSNAGWRAMTSAITMDERALKRYLSGDALLIAQRWRAYAVQKAVGVTADGWWGPITDKAVREWQASHKDANGRLLVVDGVVGGATQMAMLLDAAAAVDRTTTAIPNRVLKGFVIGEGAGLLAATNWYTPPGGRAGVDCGPAQWRQFGPPFTLDGMLGAFAAKTALRHTQDALILKMTEFRRYREQNGKTALSNQRLLELAVLNHNAPFLAWQFVRNGKLSTPNAEAVWTRKPDGTHFTHAEWARVYPETILRYV